MHNLNDRTFATARSMSIGLLLIIINSHYQTGVSSTLDIEITDLSLFSNVIFFMFILVLLNRGLEKIKSVYALSQKELLTIYVMIATSTALNWTDMIKCLGSLIIPI